MKLCYSLPNNLFFMKNLGLILDFCRLLRSGSLKIAKNSEIFTNLRNLRDSLELERHIDKNYSWNMKSYLLML